VTSNWGVQYAWKVKNAPNGYGARFYDNSDKVIIKLDDIVKAGEKIFITLKKRNYNSWYSGPIKCKVFESEDGYNWSYNKTIKTDVKSYYVEKMFSVDGDTKYLKLVNGSSYHQGSPDFLVDGLSFEYSMSMDHCPNGPEPGTACDDGNPNTINDVIGANCECTGTQVANYDVCSKIRTSSDDAEEDTADGSINLTSGDIELMFDNSNNANQVVGLRFLNLNIPNGAVVNNAYVQFISEATVNLDPSEINIYGEASDNSVGFTNTDFDISSRDKTSATVNWYPIAWTTTGLSGADQQTVNIGAIIQEIVNRPGYTSSSAISIIFEGYGKRTAVSFDANGNDSQAAELCINYSAPLQGGTPQGIASNGSEMDQMAGATIGGTDTGDNLSIELTGDITNINIEDAPETRMVSPNAINVFPIPASRDLNVDLASHKGRPARISVYNQVGQLQEIILVDEVPASPIQLNVENYQNGAYYMNIEVENERAISKKFIINRSY